MKINHKFAGAVVGLTLLAGTIGGGIALAQTPTPSGQDQIETPAYSGSITVDQTQMEGMNEADESATLQGQATITADQAQAAAEAANAGAKVIEVKLDDENGVLVYSVQLDNGLDVKVDAGNGSILHTEQADGDNEAGEVEDGSEADEAGEVEDANDTDNVQEEHEDQADDASEAPGVEDAAGQ
jgi:hypothetical protein